ncbi:MAG: methyltransferase domain-containing protein [Actinobacteria bacterium]|nr:methyltransferase domain-containing protein [Actinomycetota bacterium]
MEQTQDYDDKLVTLLEALWGEGYLSPGGNAETKLVLDGLDLRGKRVLDLGCGTGGCAMFIAAEFDPGELIGVDVEAGVVAKATANAAAAAQFSTVSFMQIEPGPLPFPDDTFDVVFSKDSIVHIADKQALADEILRVLVAGGVFAASDWMAGSDAAPSPALLHYQQLEGLGFGLASPDAYFRALRAAGFERVSYRDRTGWLAARARLELAELEGPLRSALETSVGKQFLEHEVAVWKAMCAVFDTRELGAGHWRAFKP